MIVKPRVHSVKNHKTPKLSPNQIIEITCASACLNHLPWLDMSIRPGEREHFEAWEKQNTAANIKKLHAQEKKTFTAQGPQGFWAVQEKNFGRWWRPHKLDEAFIEIMYPTWNCEPKKNPSYLIVISSRPIGASAVFQGDNFQYLITEKCDAWLKDVTNRSVILGQEGINRYSA